MPYRLIIAKPVQKQIDKLPANIQILVDEKIRSLAANPRLMGVVKVKGYQNEYRIRVRNYRVRYEVDDSQTTVKILQCGHRKDIYKNRE